MAWYNFSKEKVAEPVDNSHNGNYSTYDGSVSETVNMKVYEDNTQGIYSFGRRNNYPDLLIDLYDKSPTHQAVVNRTALMIAGNGFDVDINSEDLMDLVQVKLLTEFPNLKENLNSILQKVARDLKLHGRYSIECIWNEEHDRVVELKHVDVRGVRIGILNEENEVPFYKFSEEWNDRNYPIITYTPFSKNEVGNRQLLYFQLMRSGHLYYGLPDYYASMNWIESEAGIGESQSDAIANGFSPKVAVVFPAKPDSVEIEKKTMDNLNKTYGGTKGKKIMGIFSPRPELMPQIMPLNVDQLHKQYAEVDGQTERKILTGHGVVSPMLFGISTSNGFGSNAEELTMSFQIYQKTVVQPYSMIIQDSLNKILSESGNSNKIIINPYTLDL